MKRGLLERLDSDGVVCAEGYLFEMERRGYLTSGEFVPEAARAARRAPARAGRLAETESSKFKIFII